MIKDSSVVVTDKFTNAYVKCIKDVVQKLDKITSEVNSNINSILQSVKNNIKIVSDAQKTTEQILCLLESTQESFNLVKFSFVSSYHMWLKNISSENQTKTNNIEPNSNCHNLGTNQNENIIDLADPNIVEVQIIEDTDPPDVQIVNEIRYIRRCKAHHTLDNKQKDKQQDIIHSSYSQLSTNNRKNSILDTQNDSVPVDQNDSLMEVSFDSVTNNIEQFDTNKTYCHFIKLDSNKNEKNQDNLNIEYNKENNLNNSELSSDNPGQVILIEKPQNQSAKSIDNQDYVVLKKEQIQEITDIPLTNLRIKFSDYSDEKLHLRCFVNLEQNLKTFTSYEKRMECTLKDDAFLRLIDLSSLEKKINKRRYSSSNDLSNPTISSSLHSLTKTKCKKQKVCSDDSDVMSFSELSSSDTDGDLNYENSDTDDDLNYENSDTDDDLNYKNSDTDDDLNNENEKCYKPTFEKLDINEEDARLVLLNDSDTSDYSDVTIDNGEDESDNSRKKRKLTKTKSLHFKNSDKKNFSRSAWLNDELLKFKLPDDKNHEKTSFKDVSDFRSTSDNDMENRKTESVESLSSTDSEETESHSEDKSNEDINIISIVSANSKTPGRRNIRKVLDDQHITEITRQAVKNEENRIQRLAERKTQLHSLVKSKESSNADSLTLDFDFEMKKKLVEVDRGLVKLLKAHQKEGVRFMWDCCFESVEEIKTQKGSGCILAHCMGLGKTLQVIALAHTVLSNEAIGIETIMIVCPMNTILNWVDEFDIWLEQVENKSNIKIFELTQVKEISSRISKLDEWQKNGGVLIISYEMLVSFTSPDNKLSPKQKKKIHNLLIKPGADVVVCDEGHLLKNEKSKRANRMQSVETQRRIILTGTPLQNNLIEYHCMVEFVKPHLLGSKTEFVNRFVNPIANGQFGNSTTKDVKLMKHRAHVLHRLLEGCVQRCEYTVLTPLLPPKQEYVISIRLSKLQTNMYQHFISNVAQLSTKSTSVFKNYQEIKRLITHPKTMQLKMQRQKQPNVNNPRVPNKSSDKNGTDDWWRDFISEEDLEDMSISFKLVLLFGLLDSCAKKQDKILVFSQCLLTLDLIELFLKKLDGRWKRDFDYFRLDGKVDTNERSKICKEFNDPNNERARLFLISTRAGGLGINLTGANRVVIFDPSWNPSDDLQSIFRVFRFGQKKPCYIYRFLTAGTMEEKIYIRQVTKLSLSLRVLDEQQIERHYRDSDLADLYKLESLPEAPILNRPKDDLLAEVFSKYGDYVYKFFEHDSLLKNQEEEELNEEERKQAWLDYHQENLVQLSNDATYRPKVNQRKTFSESSVGSSMVYDTATAPSDEITLEIIDS
ncbi:transcriptional regulator ATRX-like [Phymastichus coffea]|uniref:transcriptional regulator ATRX-like n=1 Tax=Phymastichus coffea TaxID=108790 RepID=UPI00273B8E9A|nr:transcriptional regulator ATRX-like [Phymastichus coffea]